MRAKYLACILFLLWGLPLGTLMAQAPSYALEPLRQKLNQFIQDKALAHGSVGFCLMDATEDKLLLSEGADRSLTPASTMKILTTGAALGILGADYRFQTQLAYTGALDKNGVLNGTLVIIGGGDPTLGSGRIAGNPDLQALMQTYVDAVKNAGIRAIHGAIAGQDTRYGTAAVPSAWLWMDIGNYYGAGAYGLNIAENQFNILLQPGSTIGDGVTMLGCNPEVPGLEIHNELTTAAAGTGDNAYIYGAPYTGVCYARGTIPSGKSVFKVKASLPDPALFAAEQLKKALAEAGIPADTALSSRSLESTSSKTDSVLLTTYSPPLSEIIHYTNLNSINLYAEALLKEVGLKQKQAGTTDAGIQAVQDYWRGKGLDTDGLFMTDGSGLSPADGVTAAQLAQMLSLARKEPWFDVFYNSLPVAAESGSLRSMGKGSAIAGKLHAKSGHMERVRSYAGYMQARNGHWLAFALIVNNYSADNAEIRQKIDEVLQGLAL